ncbi:hypothetical protein C8F04DRAFT_1296494, partial [Mycena alexandri]
IPQDTTGFLYYHTRSDASPFEGSLRLRLTSDNMPSSFGKGRDLLGPSGFPWQMNLLQIARVSRWHRVCEQLLKENLVTTAQLAWCRDPSLPATIPLLSLFRLSQEFPIISGGQNTFAFIGEGVHPTSVSNLISQFGKTRPFPWPTGSVSARFEPS